MRGELVEIVLFGGPLGINLMSCMGGQGAYVDSFFRSPIGPVSVGDMLWSVDERVVAEMDIHEIRQLIKLSGTPLTLTFRKSSLAQIATASDSTIASLSQEAIALLNDLRARPWLRKLMADEFPEAGASMNRFFLLQEWLLSLHLLCESVDLNEVLSWLTASSVFSREQAALMTSWSAILDTVGMDLTSVQSVLEAHIVRALQCLSLWLMRYHAFLGNDKGLDGSVEGEGFLHNPRKFCYHSLLCLLGRAEGLLCLFTFFTSIDDAVSQHWVHQAAWVLRRENTSGHNLWFVKLLKRMMDRGLLSKLYESSCYDILLQTYHKLHIVDSVNANNNPLLSLSLWNELLHRLALKANVLSVHRSTRATASDASTSVQEEIKLIRISGSVPIDAADILREVQWDRASLTVNVNVESYGTDSSQGLSNKALFRMCFPQCPHTLDDCGSVHKSITSFVFEEREHVLQRNSPHHISEWHGCSRMNFFDCPASSMVDSHWAANVNVSSDQHSGLMDYARTRASSLRQMAYHWIDATNLLLRADNSPQTDVEEIEMEEYPIRTIDLMPTNRNEIVTSPSRKLVFDGYCLLSSAQRMVSLRQILSQHITCLEVPPIPLSAISNPTEEYCHTFVNESVSAKLLAIAYFAMIMECKVVLVSDSAHLSTHVALLHWIRESLRPTISQHIWAPVVCADVAKQLISCPAPFAMGVCRITCDLLMDRLNQLHDVIVIDWLQNSIVWPDCSCKEVLWLQRLEQRLLMPASSLILAIDSLRKPVTSLLTQTTKTTFMVDQKTRGESIDDDFPQEELLLPMDFQCQSVMDLFQSISQQLLHGWRYCTVPLFSNRSAVSEDMAESICVFNEQLFVQLKHRQAIHNRSSFLNELHNEDLLAEFIGFIIRSQAFSDFIANNANT